VLCGFAAIVVGVLTGRSGAEASKPLLPDLVVAPPRQILVATEFNGRKWLHFTTSIANVGPGPIEIDGARFQGGDWDAWQRIVRSNGSSYRVPLPDVRFVYQGSKDHGHWHIRGAARYELWRLGEIAKIRTKRGFCLYDSSRYRSELPDTPPVAKYPRQGCGAKSSLFLRTGVSVGWKDDYFWRIIGQRMDLTNLPNGRYRLINRVDPRNFFRETDERNNTTWADILVRDRTVDVIGRSRPL
jgi:lysyl oxidase